MEIPLLFGRFLVREGKITEQDLREATRVQTELNRSYALCALEDDLITLDEFKKAVDYQRQKGIMFRQALEQLQIADALKLDEIDSTLNRKSVKIGELLVKRGLMEHDNLKEALEEFKARGALELL